MYVCIYLDVLPNRKAFEKEIPQNNQAFTEEARNSLRDKNGNHLDTEDGGAPPW